MNPEDIATKQDIAALTAQIASLYALVQKLVGTTASEIFSLSQVERMGVLGGYDRIKRLIRNGHLKSIDGKKITRQALDECLTAQNSKPSAIVSSIASNKMLQGCADTKKEIEKLSELSGQSVPDSETYPPLNKRSRPIWMKPLRSSEVEAANPNEEMLGIKTDPAPETIPMMDDQLNILERVKDGGCGGTIDFSFFWAYKYMDQQGLIKLVPDQPEGLYQARPTTKGNKLYKKLSSKQQ